jgi:hypothetical protein
MGSVVAVLSLTLGMMTGTVLNSIAVVVITTKPRSWPLRPSVHPAFPAPHPAGRLPSHPPLRFPCQRPSCREARAVPQVVDSRNISQTLPDTSAASREGRDCAQFLSVLLRDAVLYCSDRRSRWPADSEDIGVDCILRGGLDNSLFVIFVRERLFRRQKCSSAMDAFRAESECRD